MAAQQRIYGGRWDGLPIPPGLFGTGGNIRIPVPSLERESGNKHFEGSLGDIADKAAVLSIVPPCFQSKGGFLFQPGDVVVRSYVAMV